MCVVSSTPFYEKQILKNIHDGNRGLQLYNKKVGDLKKKTIKIQVIES